MLAAGVFILASLNLLLDKAKADGNFKERCNDSSMCRDPEVGLKRPAGTYGTSRSAEERYTSRQAVEEISRGVSLDSHFQYVPLFELPLR